MALLFKILLLNSNSCSCKLLPSDSPADHGKRRQSDALTTFHILHDKTFPNCSTVLV